ncbi:MAG: tyrosine-type recombinase/integrase [Bacteroidales bacterium]|nr:tyrosine-type recombinase/integrase [Bacteroidales bacterium]
MSITAKVTFLRGLESILAKEVTAESLPRIMSTVSDYMAGFTLEASGTEDTEKDDLLGAFIAAMEIQGRSRKTIERYKYLITRMLKSVKMPTRRITVYHLRAYLAGEKSRGIADRTLEGTRQVFSAYFGWLQRERLIDENPVSNLGAIRCRKKVKQVYSDIDIERLKLEYQSLRDRAIVLFLISTGCRVSEVTGLNRSDVNFGSLEVVVLGKGNKQRTVYLSAFAAETLRRYLEQRKDKSEALFAGKGTDRLSPAGIRKMLKDLAARAHVEHVHPHKFRRTLATKLIRHGMPIQEVAAILGHDKLDTTMEYVVLNKEDLESSYRKYA